jgi:hypothetical protein
MIKHNSLEKRLNAVKTGSPIPNPPVQHEMNLAQDQHHQQVAKIMDYKQFFISEGYKLFNVMAASVLYGYGIKALFSTDWLFLGTLGVGFLLNHILTILSKLFKR